MSTQASCLALAQQTYDEVCGLSTPALPTFSEQIAALNATIASLQAQVSAVQAQLVAAQAAAVALQAKIDNAKAALA